MTARLLEYRERAQLMYWLVVATWRDLRGQADPFRNAPDAIVRRAARLGAELSPQARAGQRTLFDAAEAESARRGATR